MWAVKTHFGSIALVQQNSLFYSVKQAVLLFKLIYFAFREHRSRGYKCRLAKKKEHADSAFTFTLHLRPADYYKKDFKHVKVLLIQRMGRGYAYICSFYTDKAKTKFDKYWRRIEKTLRYKD